MTNTPTNESWFQNRAAEQIHMDQLKRAELFNGRAAMLGIVIGILTEAITAVFALVVLLTGMTVFVLRRPSDLAPTPER